MRHLPTALVPKSRSWLHSLILGLVGVCLLGCQSTATAGADEADAPRPAAKGVYLRFNVHVLDRGTEGRHQYLAAYYGMVDPGEGHRIIPVNTEIVWGKQTPRYFYFRVAGESDQVMFQFHPPRVGMTVDEYKKLLTAPKPRPLDNLSAVDMKGIGHGKALEGMSREGVRMALGYPSPHGTPSLDADKYVYWKNRRSTVTIEFGADGKVTKISP